MYISQNDGRTKQSLLNIILWKSPSVLYLYFMYGCKKFHVVTQVHVFIQRQSKLTNSERKMCE